MVRCIGRQVERHRAVMTRISSTRSLKLASRDLNIELKKLIGKPIPEGSVFFEMNPDGS
nr:hypothetical protein [Burkholderia cepacia]